MTPPGVRLIGDPVLRARATEVGNVDEPAFLEESRVLLEALEDFRARHGFGRAIAAPQIGVSKRFIAVDLGQGPFLVIDPVVTWRSEETFTLWDDCMSFPWLMVRLRRHRSISLSYTEAGGDRRPWDRLDLAASELMQHELDHLDGVLAVDRAEDRAALLARELFEGDRERFAAEVDYTIPPPTGP
ncbi:MAG: peptide deformylase [Actinomycetota bacterium]